MRKIIFNENIIEIDEGLYFGKGVFETILVKNNIIFLKEHLERLKFAVSEMNMEPLEIKELEDYILKMKIKNVALKITVTPKNIIISTRNIPYKDEDYKKGYKLRLSKVIRNSTSRLTYIKSTCYIENILEKEEALKFNYNDVLFINEKGYLTETSCANIFLVKNEEIITPKLKDGLLNGIIRKWIIDNYNVKERSIEYSELSTFDEIFITNSLMGVMHVVKIDELTFNKNRISSKIRANYERLVQN